MSEFKPKKILRLLIVDDSPDDADALARELRIARFMLKTQRVMDANSLQTELRKSKWDAVVSEYNLARFNGRQALDVVRQSSPHIPFIIFSQELPDDQVVAIMQAGARDVVFKARPARIVPALQRELAAAEERKEFRLANRAIREMEDKHRAMVESTQEAVAYAHDGLHIDANQTYLNLFGYERKEELQVIPVLNLVDKEDHGRFKEFLRKAAKGVPYKEAPEFSALRHDGSKLNIEVAAAQVNHKGEDCIQLKIQDITKRKAAENRLKYLSQRDPLTGLFNRHHFTALLGQAVEKAASGGPGGIVIYLDLYDLKEINNNLGYTAGDRALLKITKLFREYLGEKIVLARFGGDEFAMLLPGKSPEDGASIIAGLKQALEQAPLSEKGVRHACHCAASTTSYSAATASAQDLLNDAVKSCEADRPRMAAAVTTVPASAPAAGGAGLSLVEDDTSAAAASDATNEEPEVEAAPAPFDIPDEAPLRKPASATEDPVVKQIREAMKHSGIILTYQPIISLHGEGGEYYEVLIRLRGEDGKLMMPGQFLPQAQAGGIMADLDRFVSEQAIRSLAALHLEGRLATFFINLSRDSFDNDELAAAVKSVLEETMLNPRYVVFEIDEPDLGSHGESARQLVGDLCEPGCSFSIDNCGLNMENILSLPRHSVKFAKFNSSVIHKASTNPEQSEALNKLLDMLGKLDIQKVAKGIEDAGSLSDIWTFGIEYVQGNYFQQADTELNYDFVGEDETELSSEAMPSTWSR